MSGRTKLGLEWKRFRPAEAGLWQGLQRAVISQRHLVIAEQVFYKDHWAWVRIRLGQTLAGIEGQALKSYG